MALDRDPFVELSRAGRKWVLNTGQAGAVAAGAAYVLYVLNGTGKDIWIPHVNVTASAAVLVSLEVVTGTAAGGSAPNALASRIGGTAMANITTRLHTGITGLTGGDVLATNQRAAGGNPDLVHEEHGLLLPDGIAVAIRTSGAATIAAEIHLVQ